MSLIGHRLGVYDVQSLLGAGGMGEVYRARDTRLGRDVAIKVLPATVTSDRDRLARFEREARLLASLNHPNLATVYGLEKRSDHDDSPFIVMELVAGDTLAERLTRSLAVADAIHFARQIIDGLDAAHERGIVHRDLKPANIKITPDGHLKILDFGLAKANEPTAESDSDVSNSPTITAVGTRAGMILGTAAYMSPEQARGKPVDKRADIWAFGCVLFEMFTGRAAFGGETVSDIIGAILNHQPDWKALPADVPPAVRQLLGHCLEKDARKRLRDIGDARLALDAPDATVVPANARGPRAGTVLPWSVAAVVATMAAAAILWPRDRATPAVASAVPRLSPAIKITNTPVAEFGPAISPDGKWVAYYALNGGRSDLMVKFLDSGSTLNLTGSLNLELPTRAGQGGVAISPDGSSIAFAARQDPTQPQYDTWIIPAPAGGSPVKRLPTIGGVQWSPDGKQLAYTLAGSIGGDGLGVASFDGTNARVLVAPQGGRHLHWPAWSRDGQYVYFTYTYKAWDNEPSEIYRVAAAGGQPELVVSSVRRAIHAVPLPSGGLIFSGNPRSLDLGLWWQPTPGSEPVSLTNGVGEHIQSRVSVDGRRLVSTLLDPRQTIMAIPATGKGEPRALTDGFSGDLFPSADPRSGRIAFSSSRSAHRNLWIMDADGAHPTPLTTDEAIDENPVFSPDGQQIAFVSDRDGERAIWVISAQGGVPRRLAKETVLDTMTWSRDGTRIIYSRPNGERPGLASVHVSDGRVEDLGLAGTAPAMSPTDDVLAFMDIVPIVPATGGARRTVRIYPKFVDSRGTVLFPDVPKQAMPNPLTAWAPDGKRLAIVSINAYGAAQIWIVEPAAREPLRKIFDFPTGTRPNGLTWSKDGLNILAASESDNGDIIMYDVNR